MAIYTSNFARKGGDENAIAISRGTPKWYNGIHWPELAPTWDMVKAYNDKQISPARYTKLYLSQLRSLGVEDWGALLQQLPDPTYFLCFETPGQFCHRRVFAQWVEEQCGWVIPEWLNKKEVEEQRRLKMVDELLEF